VLGLLYSLMRELKAKPKNEVAFPNNTVNIQINETGVVFADPGTGVLTQVGQIQIAAFANDAGMLALGNN
jgi:flagellar basal-body rod protein FlgG